MRSRLFYIRKSIVTFKGITTLTGFYYFGELTMPGVFAWVAPLMIPLGIVAIIVGEREAR